MSRPCKHVRGSGEPCKAYAISGSDYCFWHSPDAATIRNQARKKGGLNRRSGKRSSHGPYSIKTVHDVMRILEDTVNDACALENSHTRARTIGYLCQIAIKGLEVGELEERLYALETRPAEKEHNEHRKAYQ